MIREFTDRHGHPWTVWQVTPNGDADLTGEHLPPDLRRGWLCFDGGTEGKRRFAPVPPEWETRSDAALALICRSAVPARSRGDRPQATDT